MFRAEDRRIAAHLRGAEAQLIARSDAHAHLPPAVRRVRAWLIGELRRYRLAGRFPRNYSHDSRTPVFIDEHGTRCAMAHLLELVGAHELVQRVARTANTARIVDLARDPELLRWLAAMGLTVAEAARIQPTYCKAPRTACWCGEFAGQEFHAVVSATMLERDAGGGPRGWFRIDAVLGGSGVTVGEERAYWDYFFDPPPPPGSSVMMAIGKWVSSGEENVMIVPRRQADGAECSKVVAAFPLSSDDIVTALLAKSCHEALAARDARLTLSACAPPDASVDTGSEASAGDVAESDTSITDSADSGEATQDAGNAAALDDDAGCNLAHATLGLPAALLVLAAAAVLHRRRVASR